MQKDKGKGRLVVIVIAVARALATNSRGTNTRWHQGGGRWCGFLRSTQVIRDDDVATWVSLKEFRDKTAIRISNPIWQDQRCGTRNRTSNMGYMCGFGSETGHSRNSFGEKAWRSHKPAKRKRKDFLHVPLVKLSRVIIKKTTDDFFLEKRFPPAFYCKKQTSKG